MANTRQMTRAKCKHTHTHAQTHAHETTRHDTRVTRHMPHDTRNTTHNTQTNKHTHKQSQIHRHTHECNAHAVNIVQINARQIDSRTVPGVHSSLPMLRISASFPPLGGPKHPTENKNSRCRRTARSVAANGHEPFRVPLVRHFAEPRSICLLPATVFLVLRDGPGQVGVEEASPDPVIREESEQAAAS